MHVCSGLGYAMFWVPFPGFVVNVNYSKALRNTRWWCSTRDPSLVHLHFGKLLLLHVLTFAVTNKFPWNFFRALFFWLFFLLFVFLFAQVFPHLKQGKYTHEKVTLFFLFLCVLFEQRPRPTRNNVAFHVETISQREGKEKRMKIVWNTQNDHQTLPSKQRSGGKLLIERNFKYKVKRKWNLTMHGQGCSVASVLQGAVACLWCMIMMAQCNSESQYTDTAHQLQPSLNPCPSDDVAFAGSVEPTGTILPPPQPSTSEHHHHQATRLQAERPAAIINFVNSELSAQHVLRGDADQLSVQTNEHHQYQHQHRDHASPCSSNDHNESNHHHHHQQQGPWNHPNNNHNQPRPQPMVEQATNVNTSLLIPPSRPTTEFINSTNGTGQTRSKGSSLALASLTANKSSPSPSGKWWTQQVFLVQRVNFFTPCPFHHHQSVSVQYRTSFLLYLSNWTECNDDDDAPDLSQQEE